MQERADSPTGGSTCSDPGALCAVVAATLGMLGRRDGDECLALELGPEATVILVIQLACNAVILDLAQRGEGDPATRLGIQTFGPIVTRGIVADIARVHGVDHFDLASQDKLAGTAHELEAFDCGVYTQFDSRRTWSWMPGGR